MALSKPIANQSTGDNFPLINDDDESKLISKVFDEISYCYKQDGQEEHSEPFLEEEEEDERSSEKISCAKCVEHIRIERVSQICKGLHIAMPGSKFHSYDPTNRKQLWAYMHHAIVTEVITTDDKRYMIHVKLIHMWQREDETLGLSRTNQTFDLRYDELYIVSYKFPRYRPEQIVERAEHAYRGTEHARAESKEIRFSEYNVVTMNCEHFATWCVVGKNEKRKETTWWETLGQKIIDAGNSEQVMRMKSAIFEVFGNGSNVANFFVKLLFESSDEIAKVVKSGLPDSNTVLTGAAAIYFLYCLVMTMYYYWLYSRREICKSCFQGYVADVWARCAVYSMTSVATYFIMGGGVCISAVLSSFLLIVLSIAAQHYIPDIRKALMAPYGCEKKKYIGLKS